MSKYGICVHPQMKHHRYRQLVSQVLVRPMQGVADMLASQGFKKTQVDKALMALAESGKIRCKEFGKTKIFIPIQDGLPELEPEVSGKFGYHKMIHITHLYRLDCTHELILCPGERKCAC